MGLSKLFALADARLQEVVVKGDLIISEANRNSEQRLLPCRLRMVPLTLLDHL